VSRIDVSVKDGQVEMVINGDGPTPTTLRMGSNTASRIGAALLRASCENRVIGSLFSLEPVMTVADPRFEVLRSDLGQIFLALGVGGLRPILLQLAPTTAQALSDAISAFKARDEVIPHERIGRDL
jgi:hypothetical protein